MNALALLVLLVPAAAEVAALRRFALIVGSNDGGKDRVRLRYANSDALSVARVLTELGGVREDDAVLLRDATALTLRGAVARMKQHIALERIGNERLEFVLYYSGHSNEEGLLLSGERLDYAALRAMVADMPVDVKIAILDSCASGALVRLKGGQRRQAFLVDASAKARGHAFITSSSADEASQESDRIAGSFFTHYLVSGLRGAADMTGDKRVTLNEAYQFAFNETLQRTEKTQSGPQHPSYDIQLAGSGDLVMTDVRSTRSGIVFDEPIDGRLFVRDQSNRLIVELNKHRDRAVEIGLAAGAYAVTREVGQTLSVAKISVGEGQRVALDARAFVSIERETTARRGDPATQPVEQVEVEAAPPALHTEPEPPAAGPAHPPVHDWPPPLGDAADKHRRVPFLFSLGGNAHSGRRRSRVPSSSFVLQLGHARVHDLRGVSMGLGLTHVQHEANGAMFALVANRAKQRNGVGAAFGVDIVDGDMAGISAAGAATWIGGRARGVQVAAGLNVVRERMDGLQVAMLGNWSGDWQRGVQLSLGFNYADGLSGMQVSTVNRARGMRGLQIGLVNVASNVESGFQLGLVNIARSSRGGSLGLFSYAGNVPLRLQLFASDSHTFNAGLRYGSRYVYGILLAGLQPFDGAQVRGAYGLGFGVHIPFWHLFVAIDTSFQHLVVSPGYFRTAHFLVQQRLALGGQILPHLALFAGASFNATVEPLSLLRPEMRDVSWLPGYDLDSGWRVWPGFFAGLQI